MDHVAPNLFERLRRDPSDASVPGSLPIPFFGELSRANVATVGINPSWQEYLAPDMQELTGSHRRFESLMSLGACSRSKITDDQAATALNAMETYFRAGGNRYSWFAGYGRVMEGMGASYESGTAAHLDLVQESTFPAWSKLRVTNAAEVEALLRDDVPFLLWQIDFYPLTALVCASSFVWQALVDLLGATPEAEGDTGKRLWQVAVANRNGRKVGLAGWNKPLARAPGLFREEQRELGAIIAQSLRSLGVNW